MKLELSNNDTAVSQLKIQTVIAYPDANFPFPLPYI
jgi:hypothetical protein